MNIALSVSKPPGRIGSSACPARLLRGYQDIDGRFNNSVDRFLIPARGWSFVTTLYLFRRCLNNVMGFQVFCRSSL